MKGTPIQSVETLNNFWTHTAETSTNSDVMIRAENLGKKYVIGHNAQNGRYMALRDVLTQNARSLWNKTKDMVLGNPIVQGDTLEDVWALKDLNFEVRRGEVLGIIGRNGAGKSTLLKVLSRITEPTEGRVSIKGRVASLLEVGTGFHPELTGRENIFLNGSILGMTRGEIKRKFDEIVAFAEVERFLDTPVKRYSSGMYVRLAFAVAAHLEPEILVVDEVLAVGDASFQKKCLGKMSDVASQGRTVLFVSHNLFSLQNLCSRGLLLEAGRVVMDGETDAVIQHYLSRGAEQTGEVHWPEPEKAPGDHRARLKAVRIVASDGVSRTVKISEPFRVEVEFWNLEADASRIVSIHLYNSMGVCVLTTGNLPSVGLKPQAWAGKPYPCGLYRTTCVIPGFLLNDGEHTITIIINGSIAKDAIVVKRDILLFTVEDTGDMRHEFTGPWLGAVRPRLDWDTQRL